MLKANQPVMIYLPWVVFLLGVGWMTWRGFSDKREYLRRKAEEAKTANGLPQKGKKLR